MTEIFVKVCGLTEEKNARACARAGADAIGLVFFPKSPRHVTKEKARDITQALEGSAITCGVFVNADYRTVADTADFCGLSAVQLHGSEPPELAARLRERGLIVIKAFFATRPPYPADIGNYRAIDFSLVEYGGGTLPGGNAETWNYELVSGMGKKATLMLAGGLTVDNVAGAVRAVHPRGVDASSSLESAPGIKDIVTVEAFIRNARKASATVP